MALTVKTTRKKRGTWELKEGLTVRVRDTEWHLTARAGSWGQRSPLWWSGWCYSGPDPWKIKKGRGIEKKVKSFSFHSCFQTLFFKSQLTAESVNREFKYKGSLAVPRRPRLAPDARGAMLLKAGVCQGALVPCCGILSLRGRPCLAFTVL